MKMRKCQDCGGYTLLEECGKCGIKTIQPAPPKFSPADHYGKYRRMMKKEAGVI